MKRAWIVSTLVFPFIISTTSFGQNFPRNYGNGSAIITGPELGGNNGTRPDRGYYVPGLPHVMATSCVSFGNINTCKLSHVVPPKLLIERSPAQKHGRSATKRYRGNGCATRQVL
jgi:hypothetical protein